MAALLEVVMAGLVPAIHVLGCINDGRRGCPGLRRAEGASAPQAGRARAWRWI